MPIRTTLFWLLGMLLFLGALFALAQTFLPHSSTDADRMPSVTVDQEAGANGPSIIPVSDEEGPSIRPDISMSEAMPFESSPDLDSWYAEAGTNTGAADPAPDDKSYLINSAEPYAGPDGERLILLPE